MITMDLYSAHLSINLPRFALIILVSLLCSCELVGGVDLLNADQLTPDCLYFTSSNSRVFIGQVNPQYFNKSQFDFVTLGGADPSGIAVYKGNAYVATIRGVEYFGISDLRRGEDVPNGKLITKVLVDFSPLFQTTFQCSQINGMRAFNDSLFIACSEGFPFAVVRFSLRPENFGEFLGGVASPTPIATFDLVAAEIDGQGYLFFNDAVNRVIYRANLTGHDNGTIPFACFSCTPPVTQPNVNARFRGMVYVREPPTIAVVQVSKVSFKLGENVLFEYNLDGSLRGAPINETVEYTDTSSFCPSADRKTVVVLQPVVLIPGYLVVLYTDTVGANNFTTSGIYDGGGLIYPQFGEFAQCPNYTFVEETDSGETLSDSSIVLVTVFGSGFVIGLCCVCGVVVILLFVICGMFKYKGRRKEYEGTELDEILKGAADNEDGWSFKEIDPDDLVLDCVLGAGAFGKVYKGWWRGAEVAIKTLENVSLDLADEDVLNEIRAEAQIMSQLGNHPNIVSFIGAVTKLHCTTDTNNYEPKEGRKESSGPSLKGSNSNMTNDMEEGKASLRNTCCLVLEYCPRGSLYDCLIKRKEKIPFATLIRIARDAANGILHLHKEKIIHRDIAARNILLGQNFEVYISDFGMARLKQQDVQTTETTIGPIAWMAPESLLRREYSEASDAFAFGVLLWEMVSKKIPWRGMQGVQIIIAVAKDNTRLKIPNDCDPILRNIILSVWKIKPERRMKMAMISERLTKYYDRLKNLYDGFDDDGNDTEDPDTSIEFASDRSSGKSKRDKIRGGGEGGMEENDERGAASSNPLDADSPYSETSFSNDNMSNNVIASVPGSNRQKVKRKIKKKKKNSKETANGGEVSVAPFYSDIGTREEESSKEEEEKERPSLSGGGNSFYTDIEIRGGEEEEKTKKGKSDKKKKEKKNEKTSKEKECEKERVYVAENNFYQGI